MTTETELVESPLIKLINKYLVSKDEARLTIILESFGKASSKPNMKAVKLLIEDYGDDKDILPLSAFLGIKIEDVPIDLSFGPMNQDDFILDVKRLLGDPADKKSAGNRILDGSLNRFNLQCYYKPDVVLNKFAQLCGREACQLDYYPRNIASGGGTPVWDVAILGTAEIKRSNYTKVASPNND